MMPAGKYYVGDLCYVMHDVWDEFCELTSDGNDMLSGEFTLADGRRFASYSTLYGDGSYPCSTGAVLDVDAGLIGCILVSDIKDPGAQTEAALRGYGTIIEFTRMFATGDNAKGRIYFDHHTVETGDYAEDEDD